MVEIDVKLIEFIIIFLNILVDSVFVGVDEDDNVEVCCWGILCEFDFEFKVYWDLGEDFGIFDWERGGKVIGVCFFFYKGFGVCLECVIYNFMLDEYGKEGYIEVIIFYMVNYDFMFGIG